MEQASRFIQRNSELATKKIEHELVILSPDDTKMYTLNEVARRIWELADGTKKLEEIIKQIASEYNIPVERIERDTSVFFNKANRHFNLFSFYDQPPL